MANLLDLVAIDSGFVRVATTGDIHGSPETRNAQNPFQNLLGAAWATHRVLLDLHKTGYIDSNGIGWLISSNKAMESHGGKLVVHSINSRVRDMFTLLNLNQVLHLADSEVSGKAELAGEAK